MGSFKMERKEEVRDAIGEKAFDILLGEARDGMLRKESLKQLSLAMNRRVHGVYTEKITRDDVKLEEVLQYMLDMWWEMELYKKEFDGLSCLLEILEDKNFGLQALAEKIRTSESKSCPLTNQSQQELPTNKGKKDHIITTGSNFFSRNSNSI